VGYQQGRLKISKPFDAVYEITMRQKIAALQEVVVSTGYQELPRERSTGSFSQVSNFQLNRKVSTNVLSRLQDQVPGLVFNKVNNNDAGPNSSISIRGMSTINANPEPLIILDNFPYDQSIANINPNDVESITVLKDAAAASIWGARAGNGVIVITTKKGKYNNTTKFNLSSNVTIGARPDAFYQPQMSAADYIDIEKRLFESGYFTEAETSSFRTPLTPVVESLIARRDGLLSEATADSKINALKNEDVRRDLDRYFFQKSVNQQHALNISGGGTGQKYFVSAGYDRNLDNLVGNKYDRATFNASNTYAFLKNKLEFSTSIFFTSSNQQNNNPGIANLGLSYTNLYPYAQLADAAGKPLTIARDYRLSFIDEARKQGLLDWSYQPLGERSAANNHTMVNDYRLNTSLKYQFTPGLSAQLLYQYGRTRNEVRNLYGQQTYYTRDQINNLTATDGSGQLTRPIPLGGILDMAQGNVITNNVRAQINYNNSWGSKHSLTAIGGSEISTLHNYSDRSRLYGYDDDHATSQLVDYVSVFPRFVTSDASGIQIPANNNQSDLTDYFLSYYGNAAYTYDSRYTLSASARFDQSNLFGVKTNQKGVPLYSFGAAWNIGQEAFYKSDWLPFLKVRATYGYNGNIDKHLSAYTTAAYNSGSSSFTRQPFATVENPPNPQLRWERDRIINFGLDFSSKSSTVSGSFEYYDKKGFDLIGLTAYPPSSGISSFNGNFANTSGHGLEATINSRNIDSDFKWLTTILFSVSKDKVTKYNSSTVTAGSAIIDNGGYTPVVGQPLYSIYSYKWAGLDAQNGDPQGYVNGQVSKHYAAIKAAANKDNIVYNGSARPTIFGALTNTFQFGDLSLSAIISYRLGYYYRAHSINYGSDKGLTSQHGDYGLRWQKPGDEATTSVPSVLETADDGRDYFYNWSSVLVRKADNIRLQDINLNYTFTKLKFPWLPFQRAQLYVYADNVCILWKATKNSIDPDNINGFPPTRTVAFGFKAGF
jgi:TonB-linked SusC/RagA family outer membrane protein